MRIKLILAGLAATLVLAFGTNSASAGKLSFSHGNLFNATWRQVRFMSGATVAGECDITIEGSFHYRTMNKTLEALIGNVTRAVVGTCNTGSATVLTARLPWHIRYGGFEGALPNITGIIIRLVEDEFEAKERIFNTVCLVRSTVARPIVAIARLGAGSERRLVTGVTAENGARIRCGTLFEGSFEGTGTIAELPGGSQNILVRLI